MSLLYLASLLVAIIGIALLDWTHKLAFFGGFRVRSAVIVVLSVLFFLAWDVVGISEGIFFRGSGPWMTGILLAPELPIEEVFFLIVLSYSTLISYVWATKLRSKAVDR